MSMPAVKREELYGFECRDIDKRRSEGPRSVDIKQLWQRSHEILNLVLTGYSGKQVAEILGVSQVTVSNTINSTLGITKLSEMRAERDKGVIDTAKRIAELTVQAMDVYEDIMKNPDADLELKKKTADTVVLDIAGHRAPTKIQSDSRSVSFISSREELEQFKERGIEEAKKSGLLIDVTPE